MNENDPPETTVFESDQINKPAIEMVEMGIENIDEFKPDPTEVYPHWPNVRCTVCGTIYRIEVTINQIVEGNCPKCHSTKFLTQIKSKDE